MSIVVEGKRKKNKVGSQSEINMVEVVMKRRIRCGLYRLALDLVCWPVKNAGAVLICNGYLRILRYKI